MSSSMFGQCGIAAWRQVGRRNSAVVIAYDVGMIIERAYSTRIGHSETLAEKKHFINMC